MQKIIRVPIKINKSLVNPKNAGIMKFPNDAVNKKVSPFVMNNKEWQQILDGNHAVFDEKERGSVVGTIKLYAEIATEKATELLQQTIYNNSFNFFDRCVFAACIAEQLVGNYSTTVNAIWRNMTGSIRNPEPHIRQAILNSIEKMSVIRITLDAQDVINRLQSLSKKKLRICTKRTHYTSYLLPCSILSVSVNNITVDGIKFLDDSPVLYEYANAKKQVYTIQSDLLQSEKVHNTELGIKLKNYVLLRICEIKRSTVDNADAMLLDTIINYCVGESSDRMLKKRIRQHVYDYLEELTTKGEINGFVMKDKNGAPCELSNCIKFCINVTKTHKEFSKKGKNC